jgi:hypothetical protein
MRIRNNRIPYYSFPAWVNGEFSNGRLFAIVELDVELVADMVDRKLMSFRDGDDNHWTIEWMNECFDILGG